MAQHATGFDALAAARGNLLMARQAAIKCQTDSHPGSKSACVWYGYSQAYGEAVRILDEEMAAIKGAEITG